MRSFLFTFAVFAIAGSTALGQTPAEKVFQTEKAFEKTVAEKGINAGFIEFMSPDGIIFNPQPVNGRQVWKDRLPSPASLTWNPIWIEVSANGALAYSIGNAIYRQNGKDDTNLVFNHYLSVWTKQPNGEYRAVMDTGISHEKPAAMPTEWKSPTVSGNSKLQNSAGDHAVGFFSTAEENDHAKAYQAFLADDAFVLREGMLPFVGKAAAVAHLKKEKRSFKFAKRKTFIEAGDLAWVYLPYTVVDATGKEIERGNLVQVWKLRNGKWLIGADIVVPGRPPST